MDDTRPARVLALQTIRGLWADFMAREPGTLRGEDPEQLHRMRVAHRRLRTAIDAFTPVLPAELVATAPELKWIGRELGDVRDLDVQLEAMSEALDSAEGSPENAALIDAIKAERDAARERMLAALTSSRFEDLVLRFSRALREQVTVPGARGEPTVVEMAPGMLEARYRDFRKAARKVKPRSVPEVLHKARRRARRLRFAAEFVKDAYGEPAHDLIEAVKDLQDLFGEHQDCYAAIELRRRVARALPKQARELSRNLDQQDLERAAAIRKSAPGAVKDVRKRWKALERALSA